MGTCCPFPFPFPARPSNCCQTPAPPFPFLDPPFAVAAAFATPAASEPSAALGDSAGKVEQGKSSLPCRSPSGAVDEEMPDSGFSVADRGWVHDSPALADHD